jgi:hypothetical protein
MLSTSHIPSHTTLGNEQCLKLWLGVCNTKDRGNLSYISNLSLTPVSLVRGLESAQLVCRAEATMAKNLVEKFATLRALRQLDK